MNILIIGAYPKSIISFRGQLIETLIKQGHQVTVATAEAELKVIQEVENLGAKFVSYRVQRNGLNPIADMSTYFALRKLIKQSKPDQILAYTIKPIIWGGMAARHLKHRGFNAMVTGLGYAFEKGSSIRNLVNWLVKKLYRYSLKSSKAVIFQNEDNLETFVQLGLISQKKCHRVFGSGVDTSHYGETALPDGDPTFLLIARLLGDKGIREYVAAAKIVKGVKPECQFQLLGPYDSSPDRISEHEVATWQKKGLLDYLGETNNVLPYIKNCHIYTLPSYHEGLPRTVLEAMAVGRPIITSNAVGCKDTVKDNYNGYQAQVKSSEDLAQKMLVILEEQDKWPAFAKNSRKFVCDQFDVHKVNQHIIEIIMSNSTH